MMDQCQRIDPPYAAGEKEMVTAFLDWQRATLLCKLAGLSDEQLRWRHQPSGLSLLWLVKHLGVVEQFWFRLIYAGEIATPGDWNEFWRHEAVAPDETAADVIGFYEEQVEHSRRITTAAAFDDAARNPRPREQGLTLRWLLLHMIEETARHNGHVDLIREPLDGLTGE